MKVDGCSHKTDSRLETGIYNFIEKGTRTTWVKSALVASLCVTGLGSISQATVPEGQASGVDAIAVGTTSVAQGATTIAIGKDTKAEGQNSIVIGGEATSNGRSNHSIVIGDNASASTRDSVVIGHHATTQEIDQRTGQLKPLNYPEVVAIGKEARVTGTQSVGIGSGVYAPRHQAVAIGYGANGGGDSSVALGDQSRTSSRKTLAFGYKAAANAQQSMAIGANARSTDDNTITIGADASATASHAISMGTGTSVTGESSVAIGDHSYAGLSAADVDVHRRANDIYLESERTYYDTLHEYEGLFKAAVDNSFVNMTTGTSLLAAGESKTLQEKLLQITGKKHIANLDAINALEQIAKSNSSMLEMNLLKKAANQALEARQGMNAAKAKRDALPSSSQKTYSTALGHGSRAEGLYTTVIGAGAFSMVPGGVALGAGSKAIFSEGRPGFDGTHVGPPSNHRRHGYAPMQDPGSIVRTSNWAGVSIGDEHHTRQLHNLAAGTLDTDAVNVAQLKNVNLGFVGNAGDGDVRLHDQRLAVLGAHDSFIKTEAKDNTIEIATVTSELELTPDGRLTAQSGLAKTQDIADVMNQRETEHQSEVQRMQSRMSAMDSRLNRIGAQAAALSSLGAGAYDPLEPTQITVGIGNYKGKNAMALGIAHYINGSTMIRAGAALSGNRDELMANASLTWKFGHSPVESAVPPEFKGGPLQATYVLQDKVSALEARTQAQGERIYELMEINEMQERRMAELEAINESQRAQIDAMIKRMESMMAQS